MVMLKAHALLPLEVLARETGPILTDACAIHSFMGLDEHPTTLEEKKEMHILKNKAISYLFDCAQVRGNFSFTSGVLDEILGDNSYSLKRAIKGKGGGSRALLDVRRLIMAKQRLLRKFARTMREGEKVIVFEEDEKELYNSLNHDNMDIAHELDLSVQDYDLLISGVTLAKMNRAPIGITNDTGIWTAWNMIRGRGVIDERDFPLYVRTGVNEVEKL